MAEKWRKMRSGRTPMNEYKSLKSLGIPYEASFSDELVSLLMRIAECRPFFTEALSRPLKVTLLRNAKVRAITYSNQIEGNPLHEEDVEKVIKKKKITANETAKREIQNYSDALSFAEKLAVDSRPITINDFCDLQKMLTSGLLNKTQVGRIRTIPVSIVNAATNETIDSCPEPYALKEALAELWDWLDATETENPYTRAFAFHFIAVAIHPFADGNGRTVRLMQHLLLLRSGEEIVKYIPSETAIMRHRDEYYSTIRQTKKLQRLTPMLEFLAKCFCEAAEDITKEAKQILKKSLPSLEERRDAIVKLVKKKKEIKTADVISLFPDVPRRTLERDLESLCKEKALRAEGKKRARIYKLRGWSN